MHRSAHTSPRHSTIIPAALALPLALPLALSLALHPTPAHAQSDSLGALRFFGTGVGPPAQQDRARIPIDDNLPGNASQPCDVGAASFTIDFWVRGSLAANTAASIGPGDAEFFDLRWIDGNIVVDRDIWGASDRDWGISFAAGRVRFGTGRGDASPLDSEHTIEGSVVVLSETWRHVAVVRDAATGRKLIYVDGVLDYQSPAARSRDNISYPDAGDPAPNTPWGPYIVLAAEKHDAGPAYPSFAGDLDEFRVWSRALSAADIALVAPRIVPPGSPIAVGLVGAFRFEEITGTTLTDSSGSGQLPGQLIANLPSNGQRTRRDDDPLAVAPVRAWCRADFTTDGVLTVQDIFDFLTAYFQSTPRADLNTSGTLTVQDIFDFLAAYFAGC